VSLLFDEGFGHRLEVDTAVITAAPFTFSVWFYVPTGSLPGNGAVLWVGDKDVGNEYWLILIGTNNTIRFLARTSAGSQSAITVATWSNDTWHHACGVAHSATARHVFLDGTGKVNNSVDRAPSGADRTSIGRTADSSPGNAFDGRIAEAAIYNTDLTDSQVASLAAKASPLLVQRSALVLHQPIIRDLNWRRIGPSLTAAGGGIGVQPADHRP